MEKKIDETLIDESLYKQLKAMKRFTEKKYLEAIKQEDEKNIIKCKELIDKIELRLSKVKTIVKLKK